MLPSSGTIIFTIKMIQYKTKEVRQKSQAPKASALGQPRGIGGEERERGIQDWGDICIPVADS